LADPFMTKYNASQEKYETSTNHSAGKTKNRRPDVKPGGRTAERGTKPSEIAS
jgi:hypothetical protein